MVVKLFSKWNMTQQDIIACFLLYLKEKLIKQLQTSKKDNKYDENFITDQSRYCMTQASFRVATMA